MKLLISAFLLFGATQGFASGETEINSVPICRGPLFKIFSIPEGPNTGFEKIFTGTTQDGKSCEIKITYYRPQPSAVGQVYAQVKGSLWFPFHHNIFTSDSPQCVSQGPEAKGLHVFRVDYDGQYRIYKTALDIKMRSDGKMVVTYAQEEGQITCLGTIANPTKR